MKNQLLFSLLYILTTITLSCSSSSEDVEDTEEGNTESIVGQWVVEHYIFEFPENNENFEVCGDYEFTSNGTYTFGDCQDNIEQGFYDLTVNILNLESNAGTEEMKIIELTENTAELEAVRSHSGHEVEGTIILEKVN